MINKEIKKAPIIVLLIFAVVFLIKTIDFFFPEIKSDVFKLDPLDEKAILANTSATISKNIVNHKPFDIGTVFDCTVEKLHCSVEVKSLKKNTKVIFKWYKNNELSGIYETYLSVSRKRCNTSHKISAADVGDWSVDILLPDSTFLTSIQFTIEKPKQKIKKVLL